MHKEEAEDETDDSGHDDWMARMSGCEEMESGRGGSGAEARRVAGVCVESHILLQLSQFCAVQLAPEFN